MKRCLAVFLFVSILSVLPVPEARAAGFLIFEQGTKAMGMAGAFTAVADDPAAIFNNAAGITQLAGTQISIGNTFLRNDQKYDVDGASTTYHEEMASRTFYLPHLYLTHEVNDRLTAGFGYFSPFGIGTDWPDNSVGNSVANDANIKTYNLNPNIAYKVSPKLSVALGVNYIRANIQIIRNIGAADDTIKAIMQGAGLPTDTPVSSYERLGQEQLGELQLDARGGGWAYNVGLLYKFNEFWQAGFSYRSDYKIEISRSQSAVTWDPSGNTMHPLLPLNPIASSQTEGYTQLNLPGIFLAGISTTAIPDWTFDFDVQYTTWNHFDDITISLEPGLTVDPTSVLLLGLPATKDTLPTLEEDWENGWGFHLGTEYKYTDNFAVRAGYFFDKNPIPDRTLGAILPDSDRHNFSLGCGYTMGTWTLDAAYMYSHFKDRSTDTNYQNFNADYKSDFHLLGITVTKRL